MERITTFKTFSQLKQQESVFKLREENNAKRSAILDKIAGILDEMGIVELENLDEEQKNNLITKIFLAKEMAEETEEEVAEEETEEVAEEEAEETVTESAETEEVTEEESEESDDDDDDDDDDDEEDDDDDDDDDEEEAEVVSEGTRSQFGKIDKKGNIKSVYMHYDGYPDYMLPTIKKNYKDGKNVDKVIAKGGGSGLDAFNKINFYDDGSSIQGSVNKMDKYIKDADYQGGAEYVYLFDERDGKWYMADIYSYDGLKPAFEAAEVNEEELNERDKAAAYKKAGKLGYNDQFLGRQSLSKTLAAELGFDPKKPWTEGIGFDHVAMYAIGKKEGTIKADALSGKYTYEDLLAMAKKFLGIKESVDVEEGNEFGAARAKAIADGEDEFEVDGKKFKVTDVDKEDKENAEEFAGESKETEEVAEAKSFPESKLRSATQAVADAVAKVKGTKAEVIEFEMNPAKGKVAGFYIQKATNKSGAPDRYWITDSGEVVSAFRHDTFGDGVIGKVDSKVADFIKSFKANESVVTEAEVKSAEEFKEYAFSVLKQAFGDDFDEAKAQEVVDGLVDKHGEDYGAMVGALQSSLG